MRFSVDSADDGGNPQAVDVLLFCDVRNPKQVVSALRAGKLSAALLDATVVRHHVMPKPFAFHCFLGDY